MTRWTRSGLATTAPEPAGGYGAALLLGAAAIAVLLAAALRAGWSPSPLTWYLARSSGLALYLLLFLSYLLGLALAVGWPGGAGRARAHAVHGFAVALSWGFLGLHLVSLAADPWMQFGPSGLFIPFAAGWREPWTGFGVLAMYLLIVTGIAAAARRSIGYPIWKAAHWLTYPLFLLALAHGIGAGSDTATGWGRALYLVTGAAAVSFTLYRGLRGSWRRRPPAPGRVARSVPRRVAA
ncbi:MAG: hypothetical protein ACKOWF_16925 [Chloroflexota bacterium]